MKYYCVSTVADEDVQATPEWVTGVYLPRVCPMCRWQPPGHVGPLDVDIVEEPTAPVVLVVHLNDRKALQFVISVRLFRADFFGALQQHMPEHYFGSVSIGGRRTSRYVSVVPGDSVSLLMYGDERSDYGHGCTRCGRRNVDRMVVGKQWFKRSDVGSRLVFGSDYVAKALLDELPVSLRRELRLFPIGVRD